MWIEKGAANLAKQTKSALTGLGCVGYSDAVVPIAASAAAVAVATIAVRRFWRPREQVKYILLGGGKASTELAARLPAAEVLESNRLIG